MGGKLNEKQMCLPIVLVHSVNSSGGMNTILPKDFLYTVYCEG